MDLKYNEDSFKVLNDLEAIRSSPGMYIGNTINPTHLLEELLDNSLDECLAGYAKSIIVDLNTVDYIYSVSDDGRGLPTGKDIPITISTVLHSGSKFKGSKSAYKICTGLHGVGLVAVNALSEKFIIEVFRSNKFSQYEFNYYNLINKYSIKTKDDHPFSTRISFKPDSKVFESMIPDINRIKQRLLMASIHLNDCVFILIIDGNSEIIKLSIDDYFSQYCISENENISQIIDINTKHKKIIEGSDSVEEYLNIRMCYSLDGPIMPKITSSVNLLPVENGGTHIKMISNILKDIFSPYGKKNNKFLPQDTTCGLRLHIDLSLIEPEFGGQTKTQLINRTSYLDELFSKFKKQLELYFSKNNDQLELIIERFADYRRKIEFKNIKAKSDKRTSAKYTKLKDCQNQNGELFIVEGKSAASSLIQCRNSTIHAIMPLRGKLPNIANKKNDVIKNKEVQELISAIGTGIEPKFDISKLRYNKIIICTDSDPDGNHIACLIIILFAYLTPEIIKHNKLFICKTPLFAINKDKIFIPIWNQEELDKARNGKYANHITRFKGIGEFNPWQIKICALDEGTRQLIPVHHSNNIDYIIKLLSVPEERRKLLEVING